MLKEVKFVVPSDSETSEKSNYHYLPKCTLIMSALALAIRRSKTSHLEVILGEFAPTTKVVLKA
jgi:hypothetical protein